jgi:hypothetical protein
MVFSTRDTKRYFNFDFDGTSLSDVELHKYLGEFKFTMSCKESLSFAICPIDVSSANNLPKPVIPSAMSLINTLLILNPYMTSFKLVTTNKEMTKKQYYQENKR